MGARGCVLSNFLFCRLYNVDEVLALLEDMDDEITSADVFIDPPNGDESDEDSGNEEDCTPDHFTGKQLRARGHAVLRLVTGERVLIGDGSDEEEDSATDIADDTESVPAEVKVPPVYDGHKWSEEAVKNTLQKWPEDIDRAKMQDFSPTALFELFYDDEVMNLILENTVLYATRDKQKHNFVASVEDLRRFIAILLISGYS